MTLKRNLIANYLGQGWTAIMGLAFVPLYIKYLGIEAYGIIGLFALLQAWLGLLDMGMTPTLAREMARFTGGSHSAQSIRDLLRSIEVIAFGIALLIASGIALCANWIATTWLKAEELPVEVVAKAFVVMGFITAIRFMENVYRSSIVGLQRQVLLNVVNCVMATLRGIGAVVVLIWVSASIEAFFIWQGLVSIGTLMILAIATYASLPKADRAARFSMEAVRSVWSFAGGMLGVTFLSLLLTQVDKIILSKLLSLNDYAYYSLAAVVAGALYTLISPITQAIYPRLCELVARNEKELFIETYHKGAQLVSVIGGSVAIVIISFSETFLRLWTQNNELADRTTTLLSLLMLGNLLNGLLWVPYQAQLAHGWTSLSVRINIVAVALVVPTILWVTPRFGAEGAAWVWVSLNAGYILIGIHFMYRRILGSEKKRWYMQDVLNPLFVGVIISCVFGLIWNAEKNNINDIIKLIFISLATLTATLITAGKVRQLFFQTLKSVLFNINNK